MDWVKLIPERDKCLHFMAGVVIYAGVCWLLPPVLSVVIVIVAGLGKEVWDFVLRLRSAIGSGWDWWDLVWTCAGGLTGLIIEICS